MAERDEVTADVEAGFQKIKHLRPTHRTVTMYKDVRDALDHINQVSFLLGFLPSKPRGPLDLEAIRYQLDDARAALGLLALALSDGGDE